jgi:hypothetical protein
MEVVIGLVIGFAIGASGVGGGTLCLRKAVLYCTILLGALLLGKGIAAI